MDCRQAQSLLHASIDNELDLVSQLELDDHVGTCARCSRARDAASRLHSSIGAADLYYEAPASLERKILKSVRARRQVRLAAPLRRITAAFSIHRLGFAASAGAVVLSLVLGLVLGRRSTTPLLADEIVDSHIRSLMPGHLTDEASSEHHTVKPWFAGRLDFSPEVPDLSEAGFTLAGARIDYIGGRPVAALVYRRRQHVINLFVWPPADGATVQRAEGSRRGYNFVPGRSGPNQACAVSDLNAGELRQFMRLVQQAK